jgi:hypothetical protein
MKKQTALLLLAGNLLLACHAWTSIFVQLPGDAIDFFKGIGVAFIFSAFFMEVKKRNRKNQQATL